MSSNEINKVRVIDSTIGDITDKIVYGVVEGGASITNQNYKAISQSVNSCSWNLQVPSNETIVSREVLVGATLSAQVTLYNGSSSSINVFNHLGYGGNKNYSSSFAAFPLQSACSSVSLTLNNCTITQNTNELVAMLNTFNSSKFNDRYMATCPTMRDNYQNYNNAVGTNNNPLAGYGNSTDSSKCSNGCYPVIITNQSTGAVVDIGTEQLATTTVNYLITIKVVEPLMLSPFIYDIESTQLQGIYGLSTMSLVLNFSNFNRSFRTSNKVAATGTNVGITAVSFNDIKDARLKLKYITPKNSQLLPSLNVVPYMEFPRYITGNLEEMTVGQSLDVNTSSLQLNQIPDKLICFVRKRFGDQSFSDTDSFLPINSVSIQFNNAAGLLSNTSQVELYKMASKAGINQNYLEFSGAATVGFSSAVAGNNSTVVSLCGPILALDFATDIQLSDTYFAPGSLGQFNIQVKLNVTNNTGGAINTLPSNQYEIVLVTVNSGVLTTQNGVSAIYTGILSKSDVLETVSQEQFKSRNEVKRLVGGGFFDSLKNALGSVAKVALPIVAPMVKNAISNAGYGMSAGGMSAGKKSKADPRLM